MNNFRRNGKALLKKKKPAKFGLAKTESKTTLILSTRQRDSITQRIFASTIHAISETICA